MASDFSGTVALNAIAFRLKSSAMRCGSTSAFRSAFAMSRTCSPFAASRSPSRPWANGQASSGPHVPARSDGCPKAPSPTNGTSMRWSFPSRAGNIGCGERSMQTAMFSTPLCKAEETVKLRSAKAIGHRATRHDYRQASFIWRGKERTHALRGTSIPQGLEQKGGEFSSCCLKAGPDDEALQVEPAVPTLRFQPRPDRQSVPLSAQPSHLSPLSPTSRGLHGYVESDLHVERCMKYLAGLPAPRDH